MAKKGSGAGEPAVLTNRDGFERINFLFQAATLVGAEEGEAMGALSRLYAACMRQVAQKLVIRLDAGVRRALCAACGGLLAAAPRGTRVRRGGRAKALVAACARCAARRTTALR